MKKGGGKVVTKTSNPLQDPEVLGMFNQMLGQDAPSYELAVPKYEALMISSVELLKNLNNIRKLSKNHAPQFEEHYNEIAIYIVNSDEAIENYKLERNGHTFYPVAKKADDFLNKKPKAGEKEKTIIEDSEISISKNEKNKIKKNLQIKIKDSNDNDKEITDKLIKNILGDIKTALNESSETNSEVSSEIEKESVKEKEKEKEKINGKGNGNSKKTGGKGKEAKGGKPNEKKETEFYPNYGDELPQVYYSLKNCDTIKTMSIMFKKLVEYKKYISDETNLDYSFIDSFEGDKILLLENICNFNIKALFNYFNSQEFKDSNIERHTPAYIHMLKNKILFYFHNIYEISFRILKMITDPEVDVKKFSSVIVQSISELRKHTQGCDKAFRKIVESIDLLQDNFEDYYKNFILTGNPTTIMTDYIVDVSKSIDKKVDPSIAVQFRKIIDIYRKSMNSSALKDPNVKKLFNMINENISLLDA